MKAKRIKGKDMMMFFDGEVIALSTSCDLTINANYESTATKDDGIWDDKELTNCTYSGSNDSLMAAEPNAGAATYETLFDALINGTALDLMFGIPQNQNDSGIKTEDNAEGGDSWEQPSGKYYKGRVKITSLAWSAPRDGAATYKVSFESCGPLSSVTL